jgi:hypothetical protein
MKIIRSWPATIPPNRCYVVDTLERFILDDYSYRGLGDYADDILLLEWDTAVSSEDLDRFLAGIREDPARVLVAPYRLYQGTMRQHIVYPQPMWSMRRYADETEQTMRYVTEDDATCHLWGLGMTYLPRAVISDFLADHPGHLNDTALSGWHYRNVEKETRIAWDVRPVHLHYPIERKG